MKHANESQGSADEVDISNPERVLARAREAVKQQASTSLLYGQADSGAPDAPAGGLGWRQRASSGLPCCG